MTGAKGELFGEAVVGMGEALVGNQAGRALSFSAASGDTQPEVSILSLPSKRAGLFSHSGASNVIFRSDSNGEDLETFAGAGNVLAEQQFLRMQVLMHLTIVEVSNGDYIPTTAKQQSLHLQFGPHPLQSSTLKFSQESCMSISISF